jgi:integrase
VSLQRVGLAYHGCGNHGDNYWTPRACRLAPRVQRQQEIEETGQAQTAEFPVISPHDMRHTCASLAISAGPT